MSSALDYVCEGKPADADALEVAPGVHWLRLPLPFDLNHINIWLLEDGDHWTIVDTGISGDESKAAWRHVFERAMGGRPASQVIATHLHPDRPAGFLQQQAAVLRKAL